jgi:16S rRNA (cytosine967-C5)-methyltransferase
MRQPNLPAGNTPQRVGDGAAASDGRVRRAAVAIYAAAAADWARAPGVLAARLRSARELRSPERRLVGEAVYGMIRARRRLSFALALDDAPPLPLYLAWLWSERGPSPLLEAELRLAGADPAALPTLEARLDALAPAARLAIAASLPDWLAARLADEHGLDGAERLCAAMNRRAPLAVRANRLRNTREELVARLAADGVPSRPLPLAPDGLELLTHVNAYGLAACREGRFELQDAGSQLIAEVTAPPPRGRVLDACAGAGGKTLALGALVANRGRLLALDVDERKLEELRRRARRAGLTNLEAMTTHAFARAPSAPFDRVLVDAPCSGIGVLRRNPEARWRLKPIDLEELPRLQRAILDENAPRVAPGGRLVYATCTVTRAENDAVVDGFLAAHPEFVAVPAKEILGTARAAAIGDGERLRLLPHVHDCDGFFAAVLRRKL